MLEPGELLSTMDAKVWADEFMETKARLGEKEFDHAMMLGWFANAIMAGFDEATRRQQATIADLQGQLRQVEGERDQWIAANTKEPINEPVTYQALAGARFVAKRAFDELVKARSDLSALRQLVEVHTKQLTELTIIPIGCSREQELRWTQSIKDLRAVLAAQDAGKAVSSG